MCIFAVMVFRQSVLQAERSSAKVALIRDLHGLYTTYFPLTVITFHVNNPLMKANVLKTCGKEATAVSIRK